VGSFGFLTTQALGECNLERDVCVGWSGRLLLPIDGQTVLGGGNSKILIFTPNWGK